MEISGYRSIASTKQPTQHFVVLLSCDFAVYKFKYVRSKTMSHIPYFPGGCKIWLIFTGNHLGYGVNQ